MRKLVIIINGGVEVIYFFFFSPWIKLLKELTLLGYSLLNVFEYTCL